MIELEELLEIGVAVKPQGIKGEVKIMPYADSPDALKDIKSVFIDSREYTVSSFRHDGSMAYLKLAGIETRDGAEALRGKIMLADMRSAYKMPEGRHFIVDIIGCSIVDGAGNLIGTVTGVLQGTVQDVYEVSSENGNFMMPAVDAVVKDIDTGSKRIVVDAGRLNEVALYED